MTDTPLPELFGKVREALDYLREHNTETGAKHEPLAALDEIAERQSSHPTISLFGCGGPHGECPDCAALRAACRGDK